MRKLFLSSSILVAMISFSTANAERITCKPIHVGLVRSVTIDTMSLKKNTMRIEYMDSSAAIGAAEWVDDVDADFFFSKTLNAQLEYVRVEIQKTGHARGSFYRDSRGSSKRVIMEVNCKINARL